MRSILFFLLIVTAPIMAADRQAVLDRLQGYEWSLEEAGFDALGPETVDLLLDIARDEAVFVVARERAIAALTLFPQQDVLDFYVEQLDASPNQPRKRRVVESICAAFWPSRPADVEAIFVPLLESDDIHLRTKVARCIRDSENKETRDALNAYYETIELPWEAEAAGYEKR